MPLRLKRAFTVLELTVACAIALVMSATLVRLFYSSLGWQARALRQTTLKQQMKVGMQRICTELQESAPRGIAVASNEVCIQKLANLSSDNPPRRLWGTELGVYFVNGAGLHRRPWPPTPPDLGLTLNPATSFQPDAGQLAQLKAGGHPVLLGRNVLSLEVSSPTTMPLLVTVAVGESSDHYTSTRTLSLRNAE